MPNHYPGTQSLIRGIRLLKLLGGRQALWSLNELVQEAGLNKTTVFRMMTALENEGLVERTQNGTYQLGVEMVALGGRAMSLYPLRQVALPLLERLVEETGERSTLETPVVEANGNHAMLVLAEIPGKHLISVNQVMGSRLPVHATSTGKAYLAHLGEEKREAVLQQHFEAVTCQTITSSKELRGELEGVRRRGYATAISELEIGLMAVGSVVRNYCGSPVATISIEGPDSRINETRLHELGQRLVAVAAQISLRLGYRADVHEKAPSLK